ncbi:SRPBCC family protein [Fluviispira sanaruensis]|uniref:Polyketide cyclase n=1 Tax=Fluviispira sanaruensis TaxID=2493639 RepID=A0A4P2VXM9_FLUSA|nr:SRPBCC family protein [Fluviispira sanaruensis]BBH53762.1 polyketide cyclase [Fluviispira sanaruensis]
MFLKVLAIIIIIAAGFFGYVALQPSDFRIVREIKVNTSAQLPFSYTNDLRKFTEWDPWAKLDPNAKMNFEGNQTGVGAMLNWDGNKEVGQGKATITESKPNSSVRMKIEMFKPYPFVNDVLFSFKEEGTQTNVTWEMTGKANFMYKLACVFMNRDKVIGGEFEKGLTQLKEIVEAKSSGKK